MTLAPREHLQYKWLPWQQAAQQCFSSSNADTAVIGVMRNTWVNMDNGINTIEFYSGDISGNFATASNPQAVGGAQDNGPSSVTFSGSPTGPVQWQEGLGGDGFFARIDPVGTGTSLRFFEGNNSGGMSRCVSNCTAGGASWSSVTGGWTGDTRSFIMPWDLFHGGIAGGDDCPAAGTPGGCGHLIAGTTRVWESISGGNASMTWYITNNPTTQNMTKGTLGNRSFINQLKYSPKYQSVAMVGTNDANAWIGFNLGTGVASQANWVNVTGSNAVLPSRPVLNIALDPSGAAATTPVGYAALGGFNENTPTTPGHVFQVSCTANCGGFTWVNKSGNLPNIPVDSVIVNPNFPQQVFAGSDIGLYYTDDITVASPTWYRFNNGLPNVMIWDMQIDRGHTTLSLWTRGRGAFAWPLPVGPINPALPTGVVSRKIHGAAGPFDVNLPLSGTTGVECRTGGATNDYTMVATFATNVTVTGSPQAQVTSGTATIGSGGVSNGGMVTVSGNVVTIPLTNVANAQTINVRLNDVNGPNNVTIPMSLLIGDSNSNRAVNASDVSQTKGRVGQAVSAANFRSDFNANGALNAGDVSIVKSHTGSALPP